MRIKLLATAAVAFLASFTVHAQTPAFVSNDIDAYIKKGMADWKIPGLAIAIVKDGQVVMMKGYGVRDIKTNAPVNENTLFMIASNSKLFTATALAQLEYNKQLSLDDKITQYFPDFRLYDSTTTQLVTIRDMLSHHLGTKTFQGDFTFWNSNLSRGEIMDKMQLLKPVAGFRNSFGYCNSCFLTAGEIIPKVTGKPWEVYVYDSLVVPLNMQNTHTLGYGMEQIPNASKPYTTAFTGEIKEIPYDHVDNLAPAGSLLSNVKDLSQWLITQLDSGRYEGRQVLPWKVLQRTRDLNTIIGSRSSRNGLMHFNGYGLGVFEADYDGKQVFWHTGGAFGFVTNTCFVPEERLGITILTNQDNQEFFELLRYQVLDAYLQQPFVNKSEQAVTGFLQKEEKTNSAIRALQARVKGNAPPLPLQSYTGTYENILYGPVVIEIAGNALQVVFKGHNTLKASLQYLDNDEWLLTYNNIAFGIFPTRFMMKNGKVNGITIKANDFVEYDPYIFTKKN
ncbi:serine hydrolase [Deminuibacter soli]|uniref:Serine hydrolase n=1 Tax=Deminuibacter soli TaxID=2291815 RepID=A0A3E1NK53_9BACT|nr:serine hydrolase [Deminuibacter soli]RFM28319.1 serine hydrolase [Deminuibacter soli]